MPARRLAVLAITAGALAGAAHADPCHAIPDRGPMPTYLHSGALFSGPVVYVGDGDGLCVDIGSNAPVGGAGGPLGQRQGKAQTLWNSPGASWVEVRLADFYAPELAEAGGEAAKAMLARIAMGQTVACVGDHRTYDRVAAVCRLQGVSLGDRMRAAGVAEGGRGR